MNEPSAGLALGWRIAATEAGLCGSPKIECAHLLMGLLSLDKANPAALKALGFDAAKMARVDLERNTITTLLEGASTSPAEMRRRLRALLKDKAPKARGLMMSRSNASKAAFAQAEVLAGKAQMNSLHLLGVLLKDPDPTIVELLTEKRIGPDLAAKAEAAAVRVVKTPTTAADSSKTRAMVLSPGPGKAAPSPADPVSGPASLPPPSKGRTGGMRAPKQPQSLLTVFGRDLTALAKTDSIGPIAGRRKEVNSVIHVLAQATRCNPLLVGEQGVGKAAIVEAVAIRGAAGKDAAILGGKRIVELDVNAFLTGTEYRGELEKRMKSLLEELQAAKDVILFIDGVHRLVGSGRIGQDAANALKPALVRGDLKIIGAVSIKDFRERIEKDAALDARFERIDVAEPSVTEALEIILELKPRLEKEFNVTIPDTCVETAVSLSVRFDPDLRLPHKAIDLLITAAKATGRKASRPTAGTAALDPRAIAEALAAKRGLPIELVTDGTGESARLIKLEAHLKSKVVGQDDVIGKIASRIKLARSGQSERRGPVASFLLLGPKGVGQTDLARSLAKFFSGDADALVRFGMTDFADSKSALRLIGQDGNPGELVEAIRRNPRAVLLFNDIEKAHAKVTDILIELFDTGRITDARGETVDASETIVIMTSHLGEADAIQAAFAAGETAPMTKGGRSKVNLRKLFRQEIVNRVDEVLTLRSLDEADVRRIARPLLAQVVNRIRKTHGVFLRVEPEAEAFIVKSGFSAEGGLGELQPAIERLIAIPLAKLAVSGKLAKNPVWRAVVEKDSLALMAERS